jgi:hypothetical protein
LLVYALVTTMVIFFANCGGPKSTEKFLIALAVVPTIQLVVLFFAPLTDYNGFVTLHYLFTQMEITRLGDFKIWGTIADLSLSSSGLGFGAYITLGAHCHFRSPLHFRAILIGFATSLFTVLYSVTLQNFLVSLCLQSKMLIEDFFKLEQDLAMPEAVFFLPHSSRFWMTMWLSNSYMLGKISTQQIPLLKILSRFAQLDRDDVSQRGSTVQLSTQRQKETQLLHLRLLLPDLRRRNLFLHETRLLGGQNPRQNHQ